MKRLNKDEFMTRVNESVKAMKIFIPNITDNVNAAFAIYQQVLAEDDKREAVITSNKGKPGQSPNPFLRNLESPACPECGNQYMMLRSNAVDMDGVKWASAWECSKCLSIFYSEKNPLQWMDELGMKGKVKDDSGPERK